MLSFEVLCHTQPVRYNTQAPKLKRTSRHPTLHWMLPTHSYCEWTSNFTSGWMLLRIHIMWMDFQLTSGWMLLRIHLWWMDFQGTSGWMLLHTHAVGGLPLHLGGCFYTFTLWMDFQFASGWMLPTHSRTVSGLPMASGWRFVARGSCVAHITGWPTKLYRA